MTATTGPLTSIHVTGDSPYDVVVGYGISDRVVPWVAGASTVAIARPEALAGVAAPIRAALDAAGLRVVELGLPAGEAAKTLTAVADLWRALADAGVGRRDIVIAVGGGATTDVVGFAAATWLRGVRVVHVPTTLLGMVDAAVGGKTGINTDAGKNLVGAFHPPAGVIVDLDTLAALPAAEWVNGMAEVVKAGFIADPAILDLVESDVAGARRPDGPHTRELVERSLVVKADVVGADLREAGRREILNYGHTLAHAIERVEDYHLPHGHAVSVGLVFAAALSRSTSGLDVATAERHRAILEALGLPTRYPADAWPALTAAMQQDKKSRAGRLRFVTLEGLARPVLVDAPADDVLRAAYDEVAG